MGDYKVLFKHKWFAQEFDFGSSFWANILPRNDCPAQNDEQMQSNNVYDTGQLIQIDTDQMLTWRYVCHEVRTSFYCNIYPRIAWYYTILCRIIIPIIFQNALCPILATHVAVTGMMMSGQ